MKLFGSKPRPREMSLGEAIYDAKQCGNYMSLEIFLTPDHAEFSKAIDATESALLYQLNMNGYLSRSGSDILLKLMLGNWLPRHAKDRAVIFIYLRWYAQAAALGSDALYAFRMALKEDLKAITISRDKVWMCQISYVSHDVETLVNCLATINDPSVIQILDDHHDRTNSIAARDVLTRMGAPSMNLLRLKVNLRRLNESGICSNWVKDHVYGWNHNDWLSFVDHLRSSEFWPLDESQVGLLLESKLEQHWKCATCGGSGRIFESNGGDDFAMDLGTKCWGCDGSGRRSSL